MDLSKLAVLKQKLVEATDFSDVWRYFLDHFGENPEFFSLGERVEENARLEVAISQIGQRVFKKPLRVRDLLLTRLAEHGFIHGGGLVGTSLANVLYFEEIGVGMMAIVQSLASSEMRYARFTTVPMPEAWNRSRN